jgi:serine/threonine-protein kinase PpkA
MQAMKKQRIPDTRYSFMNCTEAPSSHQGFIEMQKEDLPSASEDDSNVIDLPGYEVIRLLGEGGQAKVYLAQQLSFQRNVAIKVLHSFAAAEQSYVDSFLQEARTVASLSHPHIIPVYDFGKKDDYFYLVMEYCVGSDLKGLIKSGIVEEEVFKVMEEVASALAFSHDRGVFHLDIKPENIMFRQDNSAVLMDFGIARGKKTQEKAEEDKLLGTPTYMSPEQLLSEDTDGRADIYALGVVFYEMLTGKLPYEDNDIVELARKHANAPVPLLPSTYRKYQAILEKMLAKEPEDRYQTAMEVAKIFQNIAKGVVDAEVLTGTAAVDLNAAPSGRSTTPNSFVQQEDLEFLHELHPLLDEGWETKLKTIFLQLNEHKRKYVYERILIPKGISFDNKKGKFIYDQALSVDVLVGTLSNPLKMLGVKLQRIKKDLGSLRDPLAVADVMESSLSMIDSFECQENMALQREKILLRNTYLNDLIMFVHSAQFDPVKSQRKLDDAIIRAYMLDVFLRHQVLGYRFRTWPVDQLRKHDVPFLSGVVADEVEVRQCELVLTDQYLFLIGAVKDISQNPFSIRRFLSEEEVMNGEYIFFNAVSIPLSGLDSPEEMKKILWEISRIFTLERQLSSSIVDIIKDMEKAQRERLYPMLQRDIAADGADIELNIQNRLIDYEKELTLSILKKLAISIKMLAKTLDDMEYLFLSARRLLVEVAGDLRDFHMSPALSWSQAIEHLELKVIAYVSLLEKRYDYLFALSKPETLDALLDPVQPVSEFKSNIKTGSSKLSEAKNRLQKALERQAKLENSVLQRGLASLTGVISKPKLPEEIEMEIDRIKQESLVGFIRICKRYTNIVVYLEFEQLVELDESKRHYALPFGEEGVSHLPVLIMLYEDPRLLDMPLILESLNFDVLRDFPTNPKLARVK